MKPAALACGWVVTIDSPTKLSRAFEVVFNAHVNEEPTIRVAEVWGSRSKLIDDKDNANRYWNRADAEVIDGKTVG